MKYILSVLFIAVFSISCQKEILKEFPKEALQDTMRTIDGKSIKFEEILAKHKGKTIFIDIWASWCGDCLKGIPGVKEIQKNNPQLTYLFLSLDKKETSWKAGIEKHNLVGEHYFLKAGFKSAFCKAIDVDWIPRYMVVNPDGSIKLYEAVKTSDEALLEAIKL
ncbi:redoxin family protein [Kordia sp. YSTF-M3]|uniref:Redoxin family protein n=1 Tax=Kordia aestuariivivens TaxID=2759037 RepID=A0ABR7QD75_9FLAO|nr:thioredoxin-like domain-containing protein [Kordia aestuariivivens]MBC8756527.1 redoxin family protein [Kordia aestuariivivens]